MRKLVLFMHVSLDGYASAEGWPGFWGLEGPEYLAWLEEDSDPDATILMAIGISTLCRLEETARPMTEFSGWSRFGLRLHIAPSRRRGNRIAPKFLYRKAEF